MDAMKPGGVAGVLGSAGGDVPHLDVPLEPSRVEGADGWAVHDPAVGPHHSSPHHPLSHHGLDAGLPDDLKTRGLPALPSVSKRPLWAMGATAFLGVVPGVAYAADLPVPSVADPMMALGGLITALPGLLVLALHYWGQSKTQDAERAQYKAEAEQLRNERASVNARIKELEAEIERRESEEREEMRAELRELRAQIGASRAPHPHGDAER